MTSEIRANTLKNRVGLGTVSFTNTGPVVSGIVTANTLRLPDATSGSFGRVQLGNGLDLSLFHDGTNSFLVNNTGYLSIQSQDGVGGIFIQRNAEVNLYHGGSVRLQTSSVGVTINRDLDVDGHTNLDNVSIAGVSTFSGKVGIGTDNSSFFTHIQGDGVSGDVLKITARGSGQMVNIQNHSNVASIVRFSNYLGNAFWDAQYNTDNSFGLDYGDSEKFRITSDGNIGINDSGPPNFTGYKSLSIHGSTGGALVFGDDGTDEWEIYGGDGVIKIYDRANTQERIRISDNGAIGLGGANYGSSGQVLTSQGSGSAVAWTTISGTTINSNTNNYLITGTGTANTLQGESTLTFDTTNGLVCDSGTVRCNNGFSSDVDLILNADANNNGTGSIIFKESGSEKVRISAGGQLLVGTTSSSYKFHVDSTSLSAEISVDNDASNYKVALNTTNSVNADFNVQHKTNLTSIGTGVNVPLCFHINGGTNANSAEKMRLDTAGTLHVKGGNIEAGDDSFPLDFLDSISNYIGVAADGGSNNGDALFIAHSHGSGLAIFGYEAGGDRLVIGTDSGSGQNKIDFITDFTGTSGGNTDNLNGKVPKMRIDANGHLLHGVLTDEDTSGSGGLRFINSGDIVIDGDQKALVFRSTNSTAQLQSGIEWWNENGAGVQAKIVCDRTSINYAPSDLVFYTNDNVDTSANNSEGDITERLRITSGGRMGFGDPNPETKFHLKSSGNNTNDGILFETGTSGTGAKFFFATTDNSDRAKYIQHSAYWTEIGCHSNEGVRFRNAITGAVKFYMNGSNGSYYFAGSNLSDRNLKENIETITTSSIDLIKQVIPRTFNWKIDNNNTPHGGFIAQEMQPLFPKLVSGTDYDESRTDDGDPNDENAGKCNPTGMGFDYNGYTAYLTKAMQELIAKVETLEADNIALRARVTNLEGS